MTINDTDTQPQAEAKISSGPGATLRQAREAKGWTQLEVARRLNLRLAVIESIDSDHYKAGVALTFLRGYVKAYAKVVGVPEPQALAAFDSMSHEQFKANEPMKSFSKKTRQQASDKWLKRISWLVFLGLISSLVYWWWHDGASQQSRRVESENRANASDSDVVLPTLNGTHDGLLAPNTDSAPNTGSAAELSPTETAPAETSVADTQAGTPALAPTVALPAPLEGEPAAAENTAVDTTVDTPVNTAVENTAESPAPATDAASDAATNARLLTLNFTNDCWIKVSDSKGKVLSEGIKKAQQSLVLEGEPPFKLILGVPTVVSAEYLGKAVDLSSFGAGRAARLTVPQS